MNNTHTIYWIYDKSGLQEHIRSGYSPLKYGYVGNTTNYKRRLREHKNHSTNPTIRMYKWEDLSHKVLFDNLSTALADEIEIRLRPDTFMGWNIQGAANTGGWNGNAGHKFIACMTAPNGNEVITYLGEFCKTRFPSSSQTARKAFHHLLRGSKGGNTYKGYSIRPFDKTGKDKYLWKDFCHQNGLTA